MRALINGIEIATSDETIEIEDNHYFPPSSVDPTVLARSELSTECPWKGTASYHDVVVNGSTYPNAAWFYPEPTDAAVQIRGYIAFGPEVVIER